MTIMEQFAGDRCVTDEVLRVYTNGKRYLEYTVYRGMQFPEPLLQVGGIIEEWHGCTHWSVNLDIAINFSDNSEVCDEYYDEVYDTYGEDTFVPVVFVMNECVGYELFRDLDNSELASEMEVTIIGSNFIIDSVENMGKFKLVTVRCDNL